MKRALAAIGALLCAWAGMGMLGIVSGWSNTGTLFAKILGACFLVVSFRLVRHVIAPARGHGVDEPDSKPDGK